jgi:hypothetical protein
MRQEKFATAVEAGHKGLVYIRIPFDPSVTWDVRTRHFVRGSLNGCPFEGEIGFRRRKFYMLLDEALQRAAKLSPGDTVQVALEPRDPGAEELSSKPRLAWARLPSTLEATDAKKTVRTATKKKATRKVAKKEQPVRTPARKKTPSRKRAVKSPTSRR